MPPFSHTMTGFSRRLVFLQGLLILLFGVFFIYFGMELAWLGGSRYYVLCGIVLVLSGAFIMRGRPCGAWLYFLAWAVTIPWTIYEVGFDFWGWLPRLFGPTLIAIAVFFSLPVFKQQEKVHSHA